MKLQRAAKIGGWLLSAAFASSYAIDSQAALYNWDNWLAGDIIVTPKQGVDASYPAVTMGRFALEAPRSMDGHDVAPNDRHGLAKIGFYVRTNTNAWKRVGTAVDIAPTWSGSAFLCDDCPFDLNGPQVKTGAIDADINIRPYNSKRDHDRSPTMILVYTERTFDPDPLGQRLVMGYFDHQSGEFFKMSEPLLDPWENPNLAEKLGYFISSNEIISAWRDPMITKGFDGKWHLFFAARYNEDFYNKFLKPSYQEPYHNRRNSTVGHAIYDNDSMKWELQRPLILHKPAVQFELPTIVKHDNLYYMTLVKADWDVSTSDSARKEVGRENSLVGYVAPDIRGPWRPIGTSDKIADLTDLYGLTLKAINDRVFATAFFEKDISMTNVVEIDMNEFLPSIRKQMSKFEEVTVEW